ncbi:MAG: M23 family metallopeptidase [Bacteroidia bacterium]
MKGWFWVLSLGAGLFFGNAQKTSAQFFQHPVEGLPLTSGVFGELRTNHLHSGLDYRTGGSTGVPVLASASGHVSRIKTSATGYGLAVYLDHPNGYTTVYAHLERYASPLAEWVKARHYLYQQFELDMALQPGEIPVRQGQIIGYSGNSGGSGGPHLHFEIRHTQSEAIINPQRMGLRLIDQRAPYFQSLRLKEIPGPGWSQKVLRTINLFPTKVTTSSRTKGSRNSKSRKKPIPAKTLTYPIDALGNPKDSSKTWPIRLQYPAYVEVMARDRQDSNELTTGIYRIVLMQNRDTLYEFRADAFHFDQTRYGNSVMDYPSRILDRSQRHRCQVSPGNRLTMYGRIQNNGLIYPPPLGRVDSVQLWCYDFNGNRTGQGFVVVADSLQGNPVGTLPRNPTDRETILRDQGLVLRLPPGTLYDEEPVRHRSLPPTAGNLAARTWEIHNARIPVHQPYDVRIQAGPHRINPSLRSKVFLENRGLGSQTAYHAGTWDGNWFLSQARMFGRLNLVVDTVPPAIRCLLNPKIQTLRRGQSLTYRLSDAMTGVHDYRICVGDEWILGQYDAKNHALTMKLDECVPLGNQKLDLLVTDKAGNTRTHQRMLVIDDYAPNNLPDSP